MSYEAMSLVLSAVHWLTHWQSWSHAWTHILQDMCLSAKANENTSCLQKVATTSHHTVVECDHSSHQWFPTGQQIAVYCDELLV